MLLETAHFFTKIEGILNSNLPFVVYKKPNEKEVSVLVQNSFELFELNSFNTAGFIFAPFHKSDQKIVFPLNNCEQFLTIIEDFNDLDVTSEKSIIHPISNVEQSKLQHILLVKKAIDFILNKKAKKIVVSRKESLKVLNFNALNSFRKMLKNYPNAMVYYWFHPKIGSWMGASPEQLVYCKNEKFKTMALAGTQAYINTEEVIWKEKEKVEQQFVTDYILKTLNGVVSNVTITDPATVKAGNLLHLRTDIFGDLPKENSLEQVVKLLHPTPAICGLPKNSALKFISENECYDREFYAGYLGELNLNKETNLYVNLRCMNINNKEFSIYVGGGITAGSNPEKEWDETVFKAEVMKKVL